MALLGLKRGTPFFSHPCDQGVPTSCGQKNGAAFIK